MNKKRYAAVSCINEEIINALEKYSLIPVQVEPYKGLNENPESTHADMQILTVNNTVVLLKNNTSFKTFANLCIDRKLITLIKSSNRQKQMPLNCSVSLNKKFKEDVEENENELLEVIDNGYNPFDEFINKEYYKGITDNLYSRLSNHEKQVFDEYLTGKSYAEIAEKLNCKKKSVDTALTRIRRKGSDLIQDYNENNS